MAANVKLGKLERRHDPRTLRLHDYLEAGAPELEPPPMIAPPPVPSWPMYGNDITSDCTCAAAGHMIQSWTAQERKPATPDIHDVMGLYGRVNGGQDNGAVVLDVLNEWRKNGCGPWKIHAFATVSAGDQHAVKRALWLFGGLYLGLQLPLTAKTEEPWNTVSILPTGPAAIGSWGGHAVNAIAYDDEGITIVTWGRLQRVSWGFLATYCDESYAIFDSQNWLGDVPGVLADELEADLQKLA